MARLQRVTALIFGVTAAAESLENVPKDGPSKRPGAKLNAKPWPASGRVMQAGINPRRGTLQQRPGQRCSLTLIVADAAVLLLHIQQ